MTAIYQNNFRLFKEMYLENRINIDEVNLLAYPYDKAILPHEHSHITFGPWMTTYASNLLHINLFQVTSSTQLKKFPYVLVRDGLFTLLDFFNRFPSPKDFKPLFLVHRNFQSFIPVEWKEKILYYDFEFFNKNHGSFNNMLIVKGLWMEGILDQESLIDKFSKIIEMNYFKKMLICLPPRHNYFINSEWTGDRDLANLINKFVKFLDQDIKLKIDFEFISWEDFYSIQDVQLYHFTDLNSKSLLYIDDYSNYYLLKKGAYPLSIPVTHSKSDQDIIAHASHFHGIRIFSDIKEDKDRFKEVQKTFELLEIPGGEKLPLTAFRSLLKYQNEFSTVLGQYS